MKCWIVRWPVKPETDSSPTVWDIDKLSNFLSEILFVFWLQIDYPLRRQYDLPSLHKKEQRSTSLLLRRNEYSKTC